MKPTPLLLLVPLALASFGFSTMAPQQPSVWRQSQKTDAVGGTAYTRFTLAGKFLKSPQGDVPNRPAFALDCVPGKRSHRHKGRFLAGNLLVGTTLKIVYVEPEEIHGTSYYPKVSVRYRMDNAKEQLEQWPTGTEKTSASIPVGSLKKMLRAHTVEITADDDRGLPVVMQFDMPDPTPVEAGCAVDDNDRKK
ncbi:MAG TPA: hypothetical protein VKO18_05015 [Terriglobia bacterium]|nr:hypothetical protein [Terriglobia bacterium]